MRLFIAGATPWIESCLLRCPRGTGAAFVPPRASLFEFGLWAPLPHGHECAMQGRKDASHSNASRPEYVSAELLTRVTEP